MSIRLLCLVVLIFCTAKSASADSTASDCLDPKNVNDNVFLWESLFTKINTILSETTNLRESQNQLSESLNVVSESLAELRKRQDEQESKLTSFMENTQKHFADLLERQDAQELKTTNFMENTQTHFSDLQQGQDIQKHQLTKFKEQYFDNIPEWTTILRRQDGSVDFYRNWTEYQNGFGNPDGEFFIGMEKLHAMTASGAPQELIVILKDFENQKRIAKYDLFQIGNETEHYDLKELGTYSGDAGDSLSDLKGMGFSTLDQDNDKSESSDGCAGSYRGAWWFGNCYESHLFGPYRSEGDTNVRGIAWHSWKGPNYSLKFAEMKIRSKAVQV